MPEMIEVRCTNCSRVIMGYEAGKELPTEKYEIVCPHCGTLNRVRQQNVEEVKQSHRDSQAEYHVRETSKKQKHK